jgi:ribosome modulation factor
MPDQTITIGTVAVLVTDTLVRWTSGLQVDADGAPDAYHPISARGRDNLGNAGRPGNWYGIVCGPDGQPVVQGPGDPCPGYYVSPTSLADKRLPASNPMRYVDAGKVPIQNLPNRAMQNPIHDPRRLEPLFRQKKDRIMNSFQRGTTIAGRSTASNNFRLDDQDQRFLPSIAKWKKLTPHIQIECPGGLHDR